LFLCKSEINDAETLAFLFTENLHLYLPLTDDPDYRFEVETGSNNETKRVSVIRVDSNLELRFLL
jgi:hypothetical protein